MAGSLWAYWLQAVDPAQVAASPFNTVVVEAFNESGQPFSKAEVQQMGGGSADPRLTLAYVSAGEAENYRDYWKPSWDSNPPSFLGKQDPDWPGNYYVRFWDEGWKDIMHTYLDGVMAQGFDGAWLDVIDVYYMAFKGERADPAKDMIDFVADLSAYAKAENPNFKIYINGAEELIAHQDSAEYLAAIDGIGKEEIYYGLNGTNKLNSAEDIKFTVDMLHAAQAAGIQILDQEYVTTDAAKGDAVARAEADGFTPYVGPLDLDKLDYTVPDLLGSTGTPSSPPPPVPTPEPAPSPSPGSSDHLGDDVYIVRDASTDIHEVIGGGTDTIQTSISYALSPGLSIEKLETTSAGGTEALNLTGNELDNTIIGNAGGNVLEGGEGSDLLKGKAGADQLSGGAGSDRLFGGAGADVVAGGAGSDLLTGGAGADRFVLDTTFATDTITDFNPGADTIALDNTLFTALRSTGALDRAAFFEGPAAHDASDRLMYNSQTGDLLYDADGTGSGAAITVATLDPNLELANTNFVVI